MTADQVLRILRETDRENFTFIMDTGQWLNAIGSHPRGEFDPKRRPLQRLLGTDRPIRDLCPRQDLQNRQRYEKSGSITDGF